MATPPQTAPDLFDELLPLGLQAYPDKARLIDGIITFKIEGEGGGSWQLDCTSVPPRVHKGDSLQSHCTIELEHEDFKALISDHKKGLDLYFQNKLKISGDPNVAMKLGIFFEITRPQAGV